MEDLSLHILDIAENSIRAKSRAVKIALVEDRKRDLLTLQVTDDGEGMDERERLESGSPFFTTKHGKQVGLGLSLLAQSAQEAGGHLEIESQKGRGTTVTATFQLTHIDRKPFGSIQQTMRCLEASHPEIAFRFTHTVIE